MHTLGDFMSMPFPIASYEDFKRLVENPLFHQLLDALSIGVSLTDPTGGKSYRGRTGFSSRVSICRENTKGETGFLVDEVGRQYAAGIRERKKR